MQFFEARVDDAAARSHRSAGAKMQRIKDDAFALIGKSLRENRRVTEYDVQRFILDEFDRENLTCDGSPPMVGVNQHAADPHFEVSPNDSTPIQLNDRVLIDLWARENSPEAIYYDITWCGYMGTQPDAEYQKVFDIVVAARNATKRFIAERIAAGRAVSRLGGRRRSAAATSPSTATATSSSIAPAIRSTKRCMATARTSTTWKPRTSGG